MNFNLFVRKHILAFACWGLAGGALAEGTTSTPTAADFQAWLHALAKMYYQDLTPTRPAILQFKNQEGKLENLDLSYQVQLEDLQDLRQALGLEKTAGETAPAQAS